MYVYIPDTDVVAWSIQSLAVKNIVDMLHGAYHSIQLRAIDYAPYCPDDMTGWLLAHANRFEGQGGLAAREMLSRVAIDLFPDCDQPYAELATLYSQNQSPLAAANMYERAGNLARGLPISGRYFYEAGLIHLNRTGNVLQAVQDFAAANEVDGWEYGNIMTGQGLYYYGRSLEEVQMYDKASGIYRWILSCNECFQFHESAENRLQVLSPSNTQ